ncbi:universal stress protein [Archaeoglobus profundus]|uniref:UspA domain protein n=1 Tax=Archaeoglobus profundus (strain DSM 5631 / JCM 9629 / NBRC 100127 / Av18) TaxID=572546 RepID=D2RF64_ARCPA|nr:universal stress protein [Archaeoglobus profundus]ADB58758.1 UspA domain protein [Archaeoglobus profundus DSM 5631]
MWKVLYATDFSDHSQKVLNVLVRYRDLVKEVVVVRVINVHRFQNPLVNVADLINEERKYAEEKILEILDFLDDHYGIKGEVFYIPVGDPAEEIMRVAEKEKADVIMMGHRGRGALKKILLGSVAEGVAKISRIPVLVVKEGIELFKRVLYVPYPLDSKIPKVLLDVGKVADIVYVAHVVEPLLPPESTKRIFDEMFEKAKEKLESIKEELEKNRIKAESILEVGCPNKEILRIANKCRASCVFLKTTEFTKVSDGVLRYSKSSVMVVKEG